MMIVIDQTLGAVVVTTGFFYVLEAVQVSTYLIFVVVRSEQIRSEQNRRGLSICLFVCLTNAQVKSFLCISNQLILAILNSPSPLSALPRPINVYKHHFPLSIRTNYQSIISSTSYFLRHP